MACVLYRSVFAKKILPCRANMQFGFAGFFNVLEKYTSDGRCLQGVEEETIAELHL